MQQPATADHHPQGIAYQFLYDTLKNFLNGVDRAASLTDVRVAARMALIELEGGTVER